MIASRIAPVQRGAIGLGCSLGDRRGRLDGTVRKIAAHPDIALVRCSRWYRTPPMQGGTARGWFLNGVITFDTTLSGPELLALCRRLEERAGRRRARYWGDRTLDLDLLLLGDRILDDPELVLPHPAIADRPFVRTPLLEIWPDAIDPRTGQAFRDLPDPTGPRAVPVGMFAFGRPTL
ncbi:MAG: 2-amino-4-hydroxy-6-hydroxymethyldihydropteridine diphosphokinase [Alphaproteobacteria bacterium]|nr:2-amino-4-hydroxy-6-hydroxymethyldihydropteridine diphosphokinase [Alphaproteobacteria bacterium]